MVWARRKNLVEVFSLELLSNAFLTDAQTFGPNLFVVQVTTITHK